MIDAMNSLSNLPRGFKTILLKIKNLERYDGYLGAFVFGSVARGEATKTSDIDVKVVTKSDSKCSKFTHPLIDNIKLDLNFNSRKQVVEFTKKEIEKSERIPMIAESIILFDKNGQLQKIKDNALKAKPKKITNKDKRELLFMLYHADSKCQRFLKSDPESSLFSLGININDVLKCHYKINRKWWLSDKRILKDLNSWDQKLEKYIRKFSKSSNATLKFKYWVRILDYIARPIGEWRNVEKTGCKCQYCRQNLFRIFNNPSKLN